jgi:phosphonate transport system substrate-binding protein
MKRTAIVLGALLLSFVLACDRQNGVPRISLQDREQAPAAARPKEAHLRVAVGGMITPRQGFAYYRRFLDYLGERIGRHVDFVDRESYEEINKLVQTGGVDVAFVCGGPYVDGHDAFGMELLAAPVAYGGTVYYSYIIVRRDSAFRTFDDLRGRSFAFTDPLSNSGKLVPTYLLARKGETPQTFFTKTVYTRTHDRSIRAVSDGMVDGAAVDSLIYEYANRKDPASTAHTRILVKSPPYGIPPVVAAPGLDRELKKKVREVLLTAHQDEQGREILQGMMIERFVPIDDKAYDSIREMKKWLAKQKGGS